MFRRSPSEYTIPSKHAEGDGNKIETQRVGSFKKAIAGLGLLAATSAGCGPTTHNAAEKTEPRADATVAAPAAPGSAEDATSTSPSESEPANNPENLTLDNFSYVVDSETYQGIDAFVDAQQIKEADYPDPEEALRTLFKKINLWINSSESSEEIKHYEEDYDYMSPSGYEGIAGTADDFYNPAFTKAIVGSGEDVNGVITGLTPEKFTETQNELHLDNVGYWYVTRNEENPFRAGYTIDNIGFVGGSDDIEVFSVDATYEDNGDKNSIGEKRSREGGYQGRDTPKYTTQLTMSVAIKVVDGAWKIVGVKYF